jgi:hypothetical protein
LEMGHKRCRSGVTEVVLALVVVWSGDGYWALGVGWW